MSETPDLTPRQARDRWLNKRRVELREQTVSSLEYRLKLFVDWCDEEGIDKMGELTGWNLDSYTTERRSKATQLTLSKELGTLRNWLEWAEGVGLIEDGLSEVIEPPDPPEDQSSDIKLDPEDATTLLQYYRSGDERATRGHALLELLWITGARVGGIRALDVRDYHAAEQYIEFVHRPDSDTPLKNGKDGERAVALPETVCEVLDEYLAENRLDQRDEAGRQPLLPSIQGRPTLGTLRSWTYLATVPCHYGACPHDKDQATCEWYAYNYSSQCPSSRSPHQIRTGAITWMHNQGIPRQVVKQRVNASEQVIKDHYDKEDPIAEMEQRRRQFSDQFDIES